jgi:hypothetical protein
LVLGPQSPLLLYLGLLRSADVKVEEVLGASNRYKRLQISDDKTEKVVPVDLW